MSELEFFDRAWEDNPPETFVDDLPSGVYGFAVKSAPRKVSQTRGGAGYVKFIFTIPSQPGDMVSHSFFVSKSTGEPNPIGMRKLREFTHRLGFDFATGSDMLEHAAEMNGVAFQGEYRYNGPDGFAELRVLSVGGAAENEVVDAPF